MDDNSSVVSVPQAKQIVYENTHITGPEGYGEARKWTHRHLHDVRLTLKSSLSHTQELTAVLSMQTYVFRPHNVREVIRKTIKERIEGQKYDPVKGSQVTCSYSSHICIGCL